VDQFTEDIGKQLLTLLWYLSNYPDHEDYSETTRRDFFEDVIECLNNHLKLKKSEIIEIFEVFKQSFKDHPYENRAFKFSEDFLKIVLENDDPVKLFIKGADIK
jgi:hypothetical protein